MNKSNVINNKKERSGKLTISRITILGMFLGILITVKYALGFVPGIEMVSFLFIVMGLFLPVLDLGLLVICFNLLVIVIYGFGTWWFAYWIIWPIDAFISKGLSKITKNRFAFGLFGFIAGVSVMLWYFISDAIIMGSGYAVTNLITALPVNLIEGFTTMILLITVAPSLIKVINTHGKQVWKNNTDFKFNDIKYRKIGIASTAIISIGSLVSITLLFVYNQSFLNWKEREVRVDNNLLKADRSPKGVSNYQDGDSLLTTTSYNDIYKSLGPNEIALVIISNGTMHEEKLKVSKGQSVYQLMQESKVFDFNYVNNHSFG